MDISELLTFDRNHLWHPYSSMTSPQQMQLVESAKGVWLHMADGRQVIDGMSSWWSAIHGYNHPRLNQAVFDQTQQMAHVMFGGLTHGPAIELARQLIEHTPDPLNHVFFADSGSVAVEVAMKMAVQYWQGKDRPQKHRFITIRGGYHGDTLGAMSVCDPDTGMHHLYKSTLPRQLFMPRPQKPFDGDCSGDDMHVYQSFFARHADQAAALILEPVVQGAGGMHFYHPRYVEAFKRLCDEYDVLLIADEIATGFGRTGALFACQHANISPDILCLGKALTGGYMTLSATLATTDVAKTVSANNRPLMHGPTFMANPLACAVASASFELLLDSPWQQRILEIQQILHDELMQLAGLDTVQDVRVLGAIGVVEMKEPIDMQTMTDKLLSMNVWLRPFGKLLYTMPPYVISDDELRQITAAMRACCV